ncbi:hypothetical protein [Wolbachia endosymbiont (group A) of Epistrophe grossularia]|uniref:hypothetical protein n=1 Tax=Wolbachia endosymbiont (group A) of Epistrophe grossularia TaxID=2954008 RepID=UPI0022325575|nr:hypothetical protein [Wolbachia endosymbiont (group A) of Epistrophe grossularia]
MPLRAMQQTFIFVGNSKLLAGSMLRDTANESRYDVGLLSSQCPDTGIQEFY